MRTILIILAAALLLAACQPNCDKKIICEDGKVFPAEQLLGGECVPVEYDEDPCIVNKTKAECETNEDCIPEKPLMGAQYLCEEGKCVKKALGNPASMKCKEDNGTLRMEEGENGTYGICALPGGIECEEWAYFRGECPAPQPEEPCSLEPVAERSQCCQKELKCDVAEIAVYHASTAECTCEPMDIKRTCAAIECGTGKFGLYDANLGECICVQSKTGIAEQGPVMAETEVNTWQEAREIVLDAFDKKWKYTDYCGKWEDNRRVPDEISVDPQPDGSYKVHIEYYCGQYREKPAKPDHVKDITVTADGEIKGL